MSAKEPQKWNTCMFGEVWENISQLVCLPLRKNTWLWLNVCILWLVDGSTDLQDGLPVLIETCQKNEPHRTSDHRCNLPSQPVSGARTRELKHKCTQQSKEPICPKPWQLIWRMLESNMPFPAMFINCNETLHVDCLCNFPCGFNLSHHKTNVPILQRP